MLLACAGLTPFLYFGQRLRIRRAERFATAGQAQSYALWLVEQGVGRFRRDGQEHVLRDGGLLLAEPGTSAEFRAAARAIRLVFDLLPRPRRCNRRGRWVPADEMPQPAWRDIFGTELDPVIAGPALASGSDLALLLANAGLQQAVEQVRCSLRLGTWILDLLPQPPGVSLPVRTPVQHAEELIVHHLASGLSLARIAAQVGVTPRHLARLFHASQGMSPERFRIRARVDAARTLLQQGGGDLAAIAQQVGFTSPSSLRRAFREVMGCPPSAWRRQQSP